jgi:hypothetical protein
MELCQNSLMQLVPAQAQHDLADFDEHQTQAANRRFESLANDPVNTVADLRQTSAGCERLALAWSALAVPLAHPDAFPWTPADRSRAYDLLGISTADRPFDPRCSLLYALLSRITDARSNPDVRATAQSDLRAWIATQIADLRTRADSLRATTESTRRQLLAAGHTFDPSPEIKKLQRYESMATRLYWKTTAQLQALNLLRPTQKPTPQESSTPTTPTPCVHPAPPLPAPPIRFAPAPNLQPVPPIQPSRKARRRAEKALRSARTIR